MNFGVYTARYNEPLVRAAIVSVGLEPRLLGPAQASDERGEYRKDHAYVRQIFSLCRRGECGVVISSGVLEEQCLAESIAFDDVESTTGVPFIGHPRHASATTADKRATRELCESLALPTPTWFYVPDIDAAEKALRLAGTLTLVFKRLGLSAGRGQLMIKEAIALDQLDFTGGVYIAEQFLTGIEFSLNVYRRDSVFVTMPPVFKGETDRENVHALDRVRLIHPGVAAESLMPALQMCRRLADALELRGWAEFEFVLLENGRCCLLEINGRFSGTILAGYMSTDINPYEVACRHVLCNEAPKDLRAHRFVIELPLSEPVPEDSNYHVHKSSLSRNHFGRQSIAADSQIDLYNRVRKYAAPARAQEFLVTLQRYMDALAHLAVVATSADCAPRESQE